MPSVASRSAQLALPAVQAARPGQVAGRRPARRSCVVRAQLDDWAGRQFTVLATCQDATAHLAAQLAGGAKPGDAYCLKGDAGAGMSDFCQGFVRAAHGDAHMDVPSPTPSLVPACYDSGSGPLLLHWSLAGLPQPSGADCDELANSFPGAVSLIECAEQLRQWGAAPEQRLALYFRRLPSSPDSEARLVSVVPHTGAWEQRVALLRANLAREGPTAGLVVLSDQMVLEMLAGLPETEFLLASATR